MEYHRDMSGRFSCAVLTAALAVVGCAPVEAPAPAGEERGALAQDRELVTIRTVWEAPTGADGASLFEVGWRDAAGEVRPLPLPEPVVAAVAWGGEAAVVDRHHEIWLVSDDGTRQRLGRGVMGPPAVSDDGSIIAYAEVHDLVAEVRTRRAPRGMPRVVASDVQSAGAFRFSPEGDHLLFVGSRPGGVAGVFVAELRRGGHERCLTNCALRAGRPWGDAFIPLPPSPESLEISDAEVSWTVDGQQYAAPLRREASP